MARDEQRLSEILRELHEVLESSPEIGDAGRDALREAAREISAVVEEGGEADAGLAERLREAVQDFEEAHPRLTELVGRVADALSDIGI